MKVFSLTRSLWLPEQPEVVFSFFSDARNLEKLTPAWLKFQVLDPTGLTIKTGTRIDYRLRIRGVPVRWQSEITSWDPPRGFIDEQRRGPYRLWVHEHRFSEQSGGTLARDKVRYAVPGGALANRLIVLPDLNRVFDYRQAQLRKIFSSKGESPAPQPAGSEPEGHAARGQPNVG